jgi:hypothetical protein
METIIVKVDNKKNLSFLLNLLSKLNFVADIQLKTNQQNHRLSNYGSLPIEWAESKPAITDFAEIWKDRGITLSQLRDSAWKRN